MIDSGEELFKFTLFNILLKYVTSIEGDTAKTKRFSGHRGKSAIHITYGYEER